MNEKHYQQVLDAIPSWKASENNRRFGVTAIMNIINGDKRIPEIGFFDAYDIKKRLMREKKLPKGWD